MNNLKDNISINKSNPKLDLFNDQAFYDTYSPVILKVRNNNPIVHNDYMGKKYKNNEFIVSKSMANGLIKIQQKEKNKNGKSVIFELLDYEVTHIIPFDNLEFSLAPEDNNREDVFKLLKSQGNPFLSFFKNLQVEVDEYNKNIFHSAIRSLKNGLEPNLFMKHYQKSIDNINFQLIIEDKEMLKNIKEKHPEQYFEFIKTLYGERESLELFIKSYPGQKEESLLEKNKVTNNILSFFDNSELFLTKDEIIEIKAETIFEYLRKIDDMNDIVINTYLSNLDKNEALLICELIHDKPEKHAKDIAENLEERIQEFYKFQKDDKYVEEVNSKYFLKSKVHWQKICTNKFPNISNRIDTPDTFWDNQKLKRDQLNHVYPSHSIPVLNMMFKYLEIAEQVLNSEFNQEFKDSPIIITNEQGREAEQSPNIYLTNKGLFFEIQIEDSYPKEIAKEIINKVINNISLNSLNDHEFAITSINNIILDTKLSKHTVNENEANQTQFKM